MPLLCHDHLSTKQNKRLPRALWFYGSPAARISSFHDSFHYFDSVMSVSCFFSYLPCSAFVQHISHFTRFRYMKWFQECNIPVQWITHAMKFQNATFTGTNITDILKIQKLSIGVPESRILTLCSILFSVINSTRYNLYSEIICSSNKPKSLTVNKCDHLHFIHCMQ